MKKLLITGGAGFIGSNFIHYMLDKYDNYRIVNLDVLTYAGNLENLKSVEDNPNYRFIKGSVSNSELIERLFNEEDFDYVINFAAESHVDRSIEDPAIFIKTNVLGTQILLDAAKKHWQVGKSDDGYPIYRKDVKYLQVSTDEVYGSLGKTGMFTETTNLAPNSPYAASKTSADLIVRSYNETFKLPINITRCSNNYGPYQFPEKLIPLMINNCLNAKPLPVYGDGMQIRDWLHVKDHCSAIDTVLHKGKLGEVYNVGGNNEKANIEIVKLIIDTVREKISREGDRLQATENREERIEKRDESRNFGETKISSPDIALSHERQTPNHELRTEATIDHRSDPLDLVSNHKPRTDSDLQTPDSTLQTEATINHRSDPSALASNSEPQTINLGTPVTCHLSPDLINYGLIKYVEDRLGHDRRYAIDNTKITTELGWSPAYTFESGMEETIDWYLDHQEWLENVINKDYLDYYEKMYNNK